MRIHRRVGLVLTFPVRKALVPNLNRLRRLAHLLLALIPPYPAAAAQRAPVSTMTVAVHRARHRRWRPRGLAHHRLHAAQSQAVMTTTTTPVATVAAEDMLRLLEMERCTCRMDAKGGRRPPARPRRSRTLKKCRRAGV